MASKCPYCGEGLCDGMCRPNREPEDSMERDVTIADIGNKAIFAGDYMLQKAEERGYPGLGKTTSQADQMTKDSYMPGLYPPQISDDGEPYIQIERIGENAITYRIENIPNDQAMRVIMNVLPDALQLYLKKSRDYGGNVMSRSVGGNLGPKACIPDMQRKFGKLVDAIWWDKPLQFEQPDEILKDLLGHIFIILDERDRAKGGAPR